MNVSVKYQQDTGKGRVNISVKYQPDTVENGPGEGTLRPTSDCVC